MARSLAGMLGVILVLATMAAAQAPPPSGGANDGAELARLETVWNQAHERGDAEALERLWADDLEIAVPKMPVLLKPDAVKFWKSARVRFARYQTSDLRFRIYDNAAVVTGRLLRTRTLNNRQLEDDWRFTKVYVRHSGEWKVVSFHASEAPPPRAGGVSQNMPEKQKPSRPGQEGEIRVIPGLRTSRERRSPPGIPSAPS